MSRFKSLRQGLKKTDSEEESSEEEAEIEKKDKKPGQVREYTKALSCHHTILPVNTTTNYLVLNIYTIIHFSVR